MLFFFRLVQLYIICLENTIIMYYVILPTLYFLLHHECMQVLKDWHLAFRVLASVLIDVLILLIYTIVEGALGNLNAILVPNRECHVDIVDHCM